MSRPPKIRVEGLTFRYGRELVLDRVSFDVPAGSCTTILGPNGAGKSTLVRLLSGVLRPAAGRIEIDGLPLAGWSARELARRVAVVPQETRLDFPFRVSEVVLMGRYPHLHGLGFESEADVAAARRAMERMDVAALADRPFTELSGGEKQRVAIARALAQEAEILLLDEPATHLDLRHVVELFDELRALAIADGRTLVLVLHDLNLAALYGDHAVLLRRGRRLAAGPPDEVLTYRSLRAAFETEIYVSRNDLTGKLEFLPLPRREREEIARRFGPPPEEP